MLRRLGIRAKVLAVLAVPMLVILGAGVFISSTALTQLRLDRATRGIVELMQVYQPLNEAFQNERILSTTNGTADQIKEARAATDTALDNVKPVVAKQDLSEFPAEVTNRITDLQRSFDKDLTAMRQNVNLNARHEIIQNSYANLSARQISLMQLIAQNISNRDVAKYIEAEYAVSSTSDDLVQEAVTALTLMNKSVATSATAIQFSNLATQTETQRVTARGIVASLDNNDLQIGYSDPNADFTSMRTTIAIGTDAAYALVDPAAFVKGVKDQNSRLSATNTAILTAGHDAASRAINNQTQRAALTIAAAVAGLVLSFFVAIIVARTIVVPLRRLTAAAADVRDELPRLVEQVQVPGETPSLELPQIPVNSSDEVGRLAAAFNAVNATTVQVAQEQAALRGSIAEMFVNVARRDQVLLNRQLSFIDSLERSEEDPSILANLFRLDHLATRMRRNAESLLVLAGIDSGRRLRDSLPLSDVIRTASSEIEQYDRVELELTADPAMLGFNALPAAHLLAELLENATVFSEPETPIVVATGVRGEYVEVRIIDQGLGMSDAEIAAANEKIRSVGASDALGAQRLGLFVVGRLAQRLGAQVELRKSTRGTTGTETAIRFPATLFQSTEVSALGSYGPATPSEQPPAPEFEAPEARPVDLAALTDGQTSLGLPRRRAGVDPALSGAPAVPAAAAAAPIAPAPLPAPPGSLPQRPVGLPQRPRKTFDENAIVLPEAPTPTLSPSLSDEGTDWTPALVDSRAGSGLPSRTRAATSAWAPTPTAPAPLTSAGSAPAAADPAARAGLFSGFRGRGELSAAARPVDHRPVDQVPVDFQLPSDVRPPAAAAFFQPRPVESFSREPAPSESYPSETYPAETYPAQTYPPETYAGEQHASEPFPGTSFPGASAPVQDLAPVPLQPEEYGQQQGAPTGYDRSEPVDGADLLPADYAAYAAGPAESATEAFGPSVDDQRRAALPEWAPAPQADQPPQAFADGAPDAYAEPASQSSVPSWAAPAVDLTQWAPPAEEVPAFEPEPAAFTSYSGFTGWSAPTAPATPETTELDEPSAYRPFGRTPDEAQAWTTGTIPVVPEPAGFPGASVPSAPEPPAAWAPPVAPEPPVVPGDDWPQPSWQSPAWQPPTWSTPWNEQAPAAPSAPQDPAPVPVIGLVPDPEPEPLPVARALPEPVGDAVPVAQPDFADWRTGAPAPADPGATQLFSPVEAADAVAAPAPMPRRTASAFQAPSAYQAPTAYQAPAPQEAQPTYEAPAPYDATPAAPAPAPQTAPTAPISWQQQAAWAPTNAAPAESGPVRSRERAPRKRGLFGRRRSAPETGQTPVVAAASVPAAPIRTGMWGPDDVVSAPARRPALQSGGFAPTATPTPTPAASAPTFTPAPAAPAPLPRVDAPAVPPVVPAPAPLMPAVLDTRETSWSGAAEPASNGWAPSGWAPRGDTGGAAPQPNPAPARIGALDDDVAAMLAMRSDIQEQALSELSQLSAYRPQVVSGAAERLTKRVPTAIPEAPAIDASVATAERDPAQLRSRLSSFQSGTARGRRDAGQDGAR